jgi:hypothetical protein
VALLLTSRVWDLSRDASGSLFLAAAAGYALLAWRGTRTPNQIAAAAAPVAAALLATSTFLIIDHEPARVGMLALQGALFLRLGRGSDFPGLMGVGHALFGVLAGKLVLDAGSAGAPLDLLAYAQLVGIAIAVYAAQWIPVRRVAWAYYLGAHGLFLVWLAKELGQLSHGSGLVTLSWGCYGAALLFLALRWRDLRHTPTHGLQLVSFSAIALTIFKLLIVDLERVPILWRIGMFIGFGAALLVLSSLFKTQGLERTRRVV